MTARRPEWTAIEDNVRIGAQWFAESEQPADAQITHFGLSEHCGGGLRVAFMPSGWHGSKGNRLGVVVFNLVSLPGRDPDEPRNVFTRAECDYLKGLIAATDLTIDHDWNGYNDERGIGFDTYSVGVRGVSPSLGRAEARYHRGCPKHPDKRVFCDCEFWRSRFDNIIPPAWVAVPMPDPPAPAPSDNDRNLRSVLEALEHIRPVLADVGYHPDTIVAGRRGDIIEHSDGALSFDAKDGHGVCMPAEAIVEIVKLLEGIGAI